MHVTCWIGPGQNFYHASRLLAGLLALHRVGRIALRLRVPRPTESMLAADPQSTVFQVKADGASRLVVADFRDQSNEFSGDLLGHCDVYFKRSYYAPDLPLLGGDAAKVRPLGLNYACRTPGLVSAILAAEAPWLARSPTRAIRWLVDQARLVRAIPPARLFERAPGDPTQSAVVFQTRVWEEGETGNEPADAINEPRVVLVRALREAFGPRFRGGLVPTPLARRRYPDALARECWRKSEYVAMSGRQAVAVYTRGLHCSTAWKLPEYLAASQCIVAESPRNALPSPLVEGMHYLGFVTPDECIAACRSLLDDPERSGAMREVNHRYYCNEVAPAAWAANRLAEVMSDLAAL